MNKFDTLFKKIINECKFGEWAPDWANQEKINEIEFGSFKILIIKNIDEGLPETYDFHIGKIDPITKEVIDPSYFESSDNFDTPEEALAFAKDYILDIDDDENDI